MVVLALTMSIRTLLAVCWVSLESIARLVNKNRPLKFALYRLSKVGMRQHLEGTIEFSFRFIQFLAEESSG